MMLSGGLSLDVKLSTPDVQAMVDSLMAEINAELNTSYECLTVHSYKSQVVAGTNFVVKATSGDDVVHLVIFKPLGHTGESCKLVKAKGEMSLSCEISLF